MKEPRRFPEIPLTPSPTTAEGAAAVGFKWAGPTVGHRDKVGGGPDWLQGPDVPDCPECHEAMSFYGQLDSVGDSVALADVGMIYVFVCFDCFATRSILQSG
jgi:hypothetical protein